MKKTFQKDLILLCKNTNHKQHEVMKKWIRKILDVFLNDESFLDKERRTFKKDIFFIKQLN